MENTNRMWDDKALAEFCGVSVRTVIYWRSMGRGPKSIRPGAGRTVRYTSADVSDWLARQ
jgi:predicted DNA-binding transcriptional regulator AlpA